jgi:hypothetical protein
MNRTPTTKKPAPRKARAPRRKAPKLRGQDSKVFKGRPRQNSGKQRKADAVPPDDPATHSENGKLAKGNPWRYEPGESGNPNGRPRTRTRLISDVVRDGLVELFPGDPFNRTYAERIGELILDAAAAGNVKAIIEAIDRSEGRPRQAIGIETSKGFDAATWIYIASELLSAVEDIPEARARLLTAFDRIKARTTEPHAEGN